MKRKKSVYLLIIISIILTVVMFIHVGILYNVHLQTPGNSAPASVEFLNAIPYFLVIITLLIISNVVNIRGNRNAKSNK